MIHRRVLRHCLMIALSYARAASSSVSKVPRYTYFFFESWDALLASHRPLWLRRVTPLYLLVPLAKPQLLRRTA